MASLESTIRGHEANQSVSLGGLESNNIGEKGREVEVERAGHSQPDGRTELLARRAALKDPLCKLVYESPLQFFIFFAVLDLVQCGRYGSAGFASAIRRGLGCLGL